MLDKQYLIDFISSEFPDLKNTGFNINNIPVSEFTEKTLLPFMIYQNTTDSKNRLIELYLQENSPSIHFLPFYVAVGFYRKAVNKALAANQFRNEKFQPEKKKVRYGSSICSIIGVNFTSRTIQLRAGIGESELSFDEDYKLIWDGYASSLDIRKKLESFTKIYGASQDNIFTLPLNLAGKDHEGVILFSSISKFETLLRNLKVSGSDLRQHLNIQKAIFLTDEIKLQLISAPKTANQPTTILVARNDCIMAFDQIVESGKGKLDHLSTVIIDDFDELLKVWEKSGTLEDNLSELKNIFFNRLGKDLKDIYLICKNRNFSMHELVLKNGINSQPWHINPAEKIVLDDLSVNEENIIVKAVRNLELNNLQSDLDELILKWKELGKSNFCSGQLLKNISSLYLLREKYNSFYCPENLLKLIHHIDSDLVEFQKSWFSNGQDGELISDTRSLLQQQTINNAFKSNIRLGEIKHLFLSKKNDLNKVEIVTNNNDEIDRRYLIKELGLLNLRPEINFYNKKEYLNKTLSPGKLPDLLIYLFWNKNILNNALTNVLAYEQFFLVNGSGFKFIENYVNRMSRVLEDMGSSMFKYELLNIDPDPSSLEENNFAKVHFINEEINSDKDETISEFLEIEDYVKEISEIFNNGISSSNENVKTFLVLFDDGGIMELPENKTVYYFDDNAENETGAIQKDVQDLKAGELMLVPKKRSELKNIIEDALNQDQRASISLKYDNEWRDRINEFISKRNWELSYFRKKLEENGFNIVSDITVKNWVDGETIKPHNFKSLLESFIMMGVINREESVLYYNENKVLKNVKTSFVRSAVRKLIFSLKGINYGDDGLFDENLLNAFIDHVDIKTVTAIIIK